MLNGETIHGVAYQQGFKRDFDIENYLKSELSSLREFLLTESSLKLVKNAFYFNLKAAHVLKRFKFLSWIFGYAENSFILKIRLISKFVASQPGEQLIAIHILTIISTSKDNHAMKFGLLIRENRKIFFLKNQTKYSDYTIHIFFLKYQNRASLDQNSEVLCSLFLMYVKLRTIKIDWN